MTLIPKNTPLWTLLTSILVATRMVAIILSRLQKSFMMPMVMLGIRLTKKSVVTPSVSAHIRLCFLVSKKPVTTFAVILTFGFQSVHSMTKMSRVFLWLIKLLLVLMKWDTFIKRMTAHFGLSLPRLATIKTVF